MDSFFLYVCLYTCNISSVKDFRFNSKAVLSASIQSPEYRVDLNVTSSFSLILYFHSFIYLIFLINIVFQLNTFWSHLPGIYYSENALIVEDEPFRINFTVMGGIRYMFSNRATTKPATVQNTAADHGRRYHKARRTHRDSINRLQRIQAEDATYGGHKYSRHDVKNKSKIILEDEESVRNLDQGDIDVKSEKSLEIQKTADSAESSGTLLSPRRRRQPAAVSNQSKAFRISQLVEELNSESDRPIAQRLRTLDQVVRAALTTQTRSQFADDVTNSITSLLN